MNKAKRTVVYVSDGTGITAKTFSHAILAQFDLAVTEVTMPFIDTAEKAHEACQKIKDIAINNGIKPLIFITFVDNDLRKTLLTAEGFITDLIGSFISPLEEELGMKSHHTIGRNQESQDHYYHRIEAINYTLNNDDGQNVSQFDEADIILIGVSRCGKTPTSLFLAMQYGRKVANYPLLPEDLDNDSLPQVLQPHINKIFGLSINPISLSKVRNGRLPGSKYAALSNCISEVQQAERLMKRSQIHWQETTDKSIEEIATHVIDFLDK